MSAANFERGNISVQEPDGSMSHYSNAAFFAVILKEKAASPLLSTEHGAPEAECDIAVRQRANSAEELGAIYEIVLPAALAAAVLNAVGGDADLAIDVLTAHSYGIAAECLKLSRQSKRRIIFPTS